MAKNSFRTIRTNLEVASNLQRCKYYKGEIGIFLRRCIS